MRNPFRIRASQRSINDEEFVKLFGSGALELVQNMENPWGGLVFLRSAPGGGKTTFLRLLTPRPLQLTRTLNDLPQVKSTHDGLVSTGAISKKHSTRPSVRCSEPLSMAAVARTARAISP